MATYYLIDDVLQVLRDHGTQLKYGTCMRPSVGKSDALVGVLHNDLQAIAIDVTNRDTFKSVADAYAGKNWPLDSGDWHVYRVFRVPQQVLAPIAQHSMPTDTLGPMSKDDVFCLNDILFTIKSEESDGFTVQKKVLGCALKDPEKFREVWNEFHQYDLGDPSYKTSTELESITKRYTRQPAR
jgi:hypothetical protein